MRNLIIALIAVVATFSAQAQILEPVVWTFSAKQLSEDEALLTFKATIDPGWHLYSQFVGEGGPVPTLFTFDASGDYERMGKVAEKSEVHKVMDPNFGIEVLYFSNQAVFEQKIKLNKATTTVSGTVEFMVCDDTRCLPPNEIPFTINVKLPDFKNAEKASEKPEVQPETNKLKKEAEVDEPVSEKAIASGRGDSETDSAALQLSSASSADSVKPSTKDTSVLASANNISEKETRKGNKTLWGIFIAGFLGGLIALLMPCIFPMIPLTVSFFTKQGGQSKGKSIGLAVMYGISIIVIYVALGLIITVLFGSSKLNELASNSILNMLFFIILIIFAISFFGAFEITLPSSWTTLADKKSDKKGLLGIFFMAVALALASFSCTGPIIGSLLVEAASKGSYMGPAIGMLGFSLALAIPFTLFAIFPHWLQSMPKSGGWLNAVKVSLGFLELAFAMKFLSTVDMAYHWNILDRDIFIALWVIIFGLWGLYLIGKLRFAHDSELKFISVPRLFFAIFAFTFSIYLVPGLWGAPLKPISSFLPARAQDFDLYTANLSTAGPKTGSSESVDKKYSDLFHAPLGLNAFFDYDQAMAYAKKVNKPLFIDFTGWSCTNCRRMEASVWPDKEVLRRLNNDYVIVQLYVDDKTDLPESEHYVSEFSGKKITSVGKKWSDFQASTYNTNSQPYYVLVDHKGNTLVEPRAFDLDVDEYVDFLDRGLAEFKSRSK